MAASLIAINDHLCGLNTSSRQHQNNNNNMNVSARRRHHSSQLICRIPILVIWTLVVIFILYKSIELTYPYNNRQQQVQLGAPATDDLLSVAGARLPNRVPLKRHNVILAEISQKNNDKISKRHVVDSTTTQAPNQHLSTSTRSPISDFARSSRVFILIIEDDHVGVKRYHQNQATNQDSFDLYPSSGGQDLPLKGRPMTTRLPDHIRHLIDVLDAHRIDYTLDTTRHGLPAQLLYYAADAPPRTSRTHSVIVIDDFIKYTKLSRWSRDQLDRHCRAHSIGVIAYLVGRDNHKHTGQETNNVTSDDDDISLTSEFPLSFEHIDQARNCRASTSSTAGFSCLVDYELSDSASMLRVLKRKKNFVVAGPVPGASLTTITTNHITYEPITWARQRATTTTTTTTMNNTQINNQSLAYKFFSSSTYKVGDDDAAALIGERPDDTRQAAVPIRQRRLLSVMDRGLYDGIRRFILGSAHSAHWLNRMLLVDAIEHLSAGEILTPLERYVQIDVDDIFVGETGHRRLQPADVRAMIETQRALAEMMDGGDDKLFKFNLGFSGKYFKRGTESERAADELLVKHALEFTWFCHFWSHSKAHLFESVDELAQELRKNLAFAREKNITLIGHTQAPPADLDLDSNLGLGLYLNSNIHSKNSAPTLLAPTYAVAPHHSGVYPIHEQLYEAWRSILNVQVTSTEEYPHLRPASGRRAFVHRTIKVLPRQTCGLYTHTIFKHKYPGGFDKLLTSIDGGELFETILHNPVNIYMTHMSNYAHDRLASLTFLRLFKFVRSYTNLRLKYAPSTNKTPLGPLQLADYHFSLRPQDRHPLWTNPCDDKRHLAIWSERKQQLCHTVPGVLIVGPQKTGSTALLSFLLLNPSFATSIQSEIDFEEVQYFNDKYYENGSDWYLSRFQQDGATNITKELVYVDKSATYFDDPKVAQRAAAMLPNARVVIILIDPADRAYSWYQHMRAHKNSLALSMSFDELLFSSNSIENNTSSVSPNASQLHALRKRCLEPGYYAIHLLKWLEFYPPRQIFIIDGEWFKYNPIAVMDRLQNLLNANQLVDYNQLLEFSATKGFYCERRRNNRIELKCLGTGKGRKYAPMSNAARAYLNEHFWRHNRHLARLLYEIGQPVPQWLDDSINSITNLKHRIK